MALVFLSIGIHFILEVSLSVLSIISPSKHLSIYICIYLSFYLSISLSIHSLSPFLSLSIYLSISIGWGLLYCGLEFQVLGEEYNALHLGIYLFNLFASTLISSILFSSVLFFYFLYSINNNNHNNNNNTNNNINNNNNNNKSFSPQLYLFLPLWFRTPGLVYYLHHYC